MADTMQGTAIMGIMDTTEHVMDSYRITSTANRISMELDDINLLPAAIEYLAKMGIDLSKTAEALRKAEEEQRKRKEAEGFEARRQQAIDAAYDAARQGMRCFVIAYNKTDNKAEIGTAEGVLHSDSHLHIDHSAPYPIAGYTSNEEELRQLCSNYGYEVRIRLFPAEI